MSNPPPSDPPRPDPNAEPYGSSWPVGRSAVPPPGHGRSGYRTGDPETSGFASPYDPPTGYEPPPGSGPPGYPPPPGYGSPGYGSPGDGSPGYGSPGSGSGPGGPRHSNVPLIAVIIAVAILLCGGTATATVLAIRNAADRAREAVKPIAQPTRSAAPNKAPKPPIAPKTTPTTEPGIPGLPTLPSGWPSLPGQGSTITVTYEVTGNGPAEILYAERLGRNPVRIRNVKLPWKITTKMDGTALVLVTAVRVGPEPGSIGCRATVDGHQVAQSTHEGSFVSVTCSKLIIPR